MQALIGYIVAELQTDGTVEIMISEYKFSNAERCVLGEFEYIPDFDTSVINDLKVNFAEGLEKALVALKADNRKSEAQMAVAIQNLLALDAPQED